MAIDVFSLAGKIAINYSDAVSGLDRIKSAAGEAADELEDVDGAASDAGDSMEDAGDSAEKAGDGFTIWKGVISNLVTNVITGLISKCQQLAGQIGELVKTAVGNYADYEQLVGGVETLFGGSADKLIGYAEDAYKNVQLSSNDYMETATSFAASLIQGLGGDTDAAVELTNLAITDMADNANKMGSDIESIQSAYQGFAKQNYTMLDNLKLGYGGTQSEMIRLINDSGILDEEISSLDNITFDQMIEAIHQIQTNLGITGTSAEEAATTLSGSWNSVQALFQNILTKIGEQLAPVIMDFLGKLSDWMESVDWDKVAETLGSAFDSIFEFIENIDFESFFETTLNGILQVITYGGQLIAWIINVIQWLTEHKTVATILITVLGVLAGVILAIVNPVGTLIACITTLVGIIAYLIAQFVSWCQEGEKVKAMFEKIKEVVSVVMEAIVGFFQSAWETIKSVWSAVTDFFSGIWDGIQGAFSSVVDFFTGIFSSAWDGIKNAFSAVENFFKGIWDGIKNAFSSVTDWFRDVFSEAWNAVKNVFSAGGEIFEGIVEGISDVFITVVNAIINGINAVIAVPFNAINSALEKIRDISILGLTPFDWISTFDVPQIPTLAQGGVLKRGQVGLLEGDGSEAVVPLEQNTGWAEQVAKLISESPNSGNGNAEVLRKLDAIASQFEKLFSLLSEYFPQFANMQWVMDTGVVAGQLAPKIDKELGVLAKRKGR